MLSIPEWIAILIGTHLKISKIILFLPVDGSSYSNILSLMREKQLDHKGSKILKFKRKIHGIFLLFTYSPPHTSVKHCPQCGRL